MCFPLLSICYSWSKTTGKLQSKYQTLLADDGKTRLDVNWGTNPNHVNWHNVILHLLRLNFQFSHTRNTCSIRPLSLEAFVFLLSGEITALREAVNNVEDGDVRRVMGQQGHALYSRNISDEILMTLSYPELLAHHHWINLWGKFLKFSFEIFLKSKVNWGSISHFLKLSNFTMVSNFDWKWKSSRNWIPIPQILVLYKVLYHFFSAVSTLYWPAGLVLILNELWLQQTKSY